MKRLEDIPKKNIYQVPDGYFDNLPTIIQARVAEESSTRTPSFAYRMRFAIPAFAIAILGVVWVFTKDDNAMSAEELLATVDTAELVAYLEESEMTTDDLLETVSFSQEEAAAIERDVYDITIGQDDLDELINEYQLDIDNF